MENLKKVRTAVIGAGSMGRHHVRNYFEVEEGELVAIADIDERQGRDLSSKYRCKYYRDYTEMVEKESPEAVTIAVPSSLHHKVGTDLMSRGIHVLIEKPIATTLKEAKELINCAKLNEVKLMVGHIERFNSGVAKLKEIIEKGELGEVTSVIARRVGLFPPRIKDANVIIDLAVHDIDIINYLLNKEPNEVFSNGGRAIVDGREDYAELFLKYGNTSGFIQVNWITPVKIRNIAVTGTKGYAELNYITQKLQLFRSRYSKSEDSFGDFVIKFGEPERKDIKIEPKEPLKMEIKAFLKSILENKPSPISGEEGLKALKTALYSIDYFSKNLAKRDK